MATAAEYKSPNNESWKTSQSAKYLLSACLLNSKIQSQKKSEINSSYLLRKLSLVIWFSMAVNLSPKERLNQKVSFYGGITVVSYHKSIYTLKK